MADKNILQTDSAERVSLDLAKIIYNSEDQPFDRAGWLTLYSQCLKVVSRHDPEQVLQSG